MGSVDLATFNGNTSFRALKDVDLSFFSGFRYRKGWKGWKGRMNFSAALG